MIKLTNSLSLGTVILLPVTMSVFKVMLMTQSFFFLYGVLFLFFLIVLLLFIFLSSFFIFCFIFY